MNPAVQTLLNSVESTASYVWGSNAERRLHRRQAFATTDCEGQPSLFLTITPNVDGTMSLAYTAGGVSVGSLFDAQFLKDLHSNAILHKMAFTDNMASATLFDRSVQAFIDIVLGYNSVKCAPRRQGGLFGHVKSYYGMVETQGTISTLRLQHYDFR